MVTIIKGHVLGLSQDIQSLLEKLTHECSSKLLHSFYLLKKLCMVVRSTSEQPMSHVHKKQCTRCTNTGIRDCGVLSSE